MSYEIHYNGDDTDLLSTYIEALARKEFVAELRVDDRPFDVVVVGYNPARDVALVRNWTEEAGASGSSREIPVSKIQEILVY